MGEFSNYNAPEILKNIEACIAELTKINNDEEGAKAIYPRHKMLQHRSGKGIVYGFGMSEVCDELSIFDWWEETLSMNQLKQMRRFVKQAIRLGFTGYVCFKVGVSGCAHGMWAYKNESTTGFSPDDDNILFHSFRSEDNYYSLKWEGAWHHDEMNLKEVKALIGA